MGTSRQMGRVEKVAFFGTRLKAMQSRGILSATAARPDICARPSRLTVAVKAPQISEACHMYLLFPKQP